MLLTMLTTIDNPFDPFTQYDAWESEDLRLSRINDRIDCNSYLARVARTSPSLNAEEHRKEVEQAINSIVRTNPLNVYRKVVRDV